MKLKYVLGIIYLLGQSCLLAQDSKAEISFKIIEETINIISTEDKWTKEGEFEDDCMSDRDQYTLACALKHAQLKVRGEYKDRSCEMEAIRISIAFNHFCRLAYHPIYGFNKHPETSYSDIISLLRKVRHKYSK